MAARVVLLASGSGSLAQAIIDAEELDIEIVALISDNPDAHALTRAKEASIQTVFQQTKIKCIGQAGEESKLLEIKRDRS